MNLKEQGLNAVNSFRGEATSEASRLVYNGSATLFSNVIKTELEPNKYILTDLGSHRGEFLEDLLNLLPEYTFETIAVDVNSCDLKENKADKKFISDLSKLDMNDKSVDATIIRYALSWNDLENQKNIIKEIKRITKKIAIIQHQGANSEHPEELWNASRQLFSGTVPKLKRDKFFFSTPKQVEEFMNELEITFEKVQEEEVKGLSDLLIEKYDLSEEDSHNTKDILKNSDYVVKSAWVLRF